MKIGITKKGVTWVVVIVSSIATLLLGYFFSIPNSQSLVITDGIKDRQSGTSLQCRAFEGSGEALDNQGHINVLVWNLYKQNRQNWKSELTEHLQGAQIGLLQEVSLTDEFKAWLYKENWVGQQAKAFEALDVSTGVLNLAPVYPLRICAQLDTEPWIRLPKSALFATYPLSNGEIIAVGNLHGINFTLGTNEYFKQVLALVNKLKHHHGPVILGGDFNTWSDGRLEKLAQVVSDANLQEVFFSSGHQTEFLNGHVLDHIYYRGLTLVKAEAPASDASDHNPLLAHFVIRETKLSL
ncbi:hypothetical protein A9264_10390 [Vibrio sp. UCD-FRSSP16_10]|uniref:endonuclease/exonuclease/phosphatase family protein n=1 Tax=unclassified Vibrio TaxID=2614977 RepID=UPI0007FD8CD1|nr:MULTISPECIES: endonuclease/exonuclease/phosphatase family protein [unclassified Vibrio]OBT16893.1 hypothetical protein A9260_10615 [Vibrio sp. UCD-FRSSP16_30]OBT21881.1 hypothetical protein A9264_10390 [Vibrio sp. UCD-FRSSP16_10]